MSTSHSFYEELKRRGVIRVALAYVSAAWVLLQVADVLFPALGAPDWTLRVIAIASLIGFPIAIALAWAYKVTADGVQREDAADTGEALPSLGRFLNVAIITLLTIAVSWFAVDKFTARDNSTLATVEPTIVILPFVNTSDDEAQEYFSDGLTDELLQLISRVDGLRVIGRTSSFLFKDRTRGSIEIGQQLGADYLLDGSVRRSGDRVRIVASLIDTKDGVEVWTQTYDENFDHLFDVQNAIARAVVVELEVEFLGLTVASVNPEAYDLYLRALKLSHTGGLASAQQGIDYLERALELDPGLASGWALLARMVMRTVTVGSADTDEGIARADAALSEALKLDPTLVEAHVTRGTILSNFYWDWENAGQSYRQALQLEPDNPAALRGAAGLLASQGKLSEAIELTRHSRRIDPLSIASLHNEAFFQYLNRDYAAAESTLRENLRAIGYAYPTGKTLLSLTLIEVGRYDEALAEVKTEPAEPFRLAGLALAHHKLGDTEKATIYQNQLVERFGDRLAVPIAGFFSQRGDPDAAFDWLERAYEQRDAQLLWTKVHPMNDPLREDPRFDVLLQRLGMAR